MRYVCHRRARFEGISGRVNIPYGAALERRGDFLYYQGRQLCAAGSQRAHEHFKRDDDGQGLRRGALTEAIAGTPDTRTDGTGCGRTSCAGSTGTRTTRTTSSGATPSLRHPSQI